MVVSIRVSFKTIKCMVLVSSYNKMEKCTKECGARASNMAKELLRLLMVAKRRASGNMAKEQSGSVMTSQLPKVSQKVILMINSIFGRDQNKFLLK